MVKLHCKSLRVTATLSVTVKLLRKPLSVTATLSDRVKSHCKSLDVNGGAGLENLRLAYRMHRGRPKSAVA